MRIGIVTHPFWTNYGGNLQAFALQTILERMGHEVFFVHRGRNDRGVKKVLRAIIEKTLFSLPYFNRFPIIDKVLRIKKAYEKRNFASFVRRNIHNHYYLDESNNQSLDILIAGSDQIWRKWGETWDIMFYFLDFARKWCVKKYSYAASLGVNTWNFSSEETVEIINLLKQFDGISVREKDAIGLLKEITSLNSEWVLDPTLLLSAEDYMKELDIREIGNEKLVTYILDKDINKESVIANVSLLKKYNPFEIGKPIYSREKIAELPSIESWLSHFMGAEFVITDSFHGTAFAINFNKNFVVLSNPLRGQSRLLSILSMFGLEDRLVTSNEEAIRVSCVPIDWETVKKKLCIEREKSMRFLKKINNNYDICCHTSL